MTMAKTTFRSATMGAGDTFAIIIGILITMSMEKLSFNNSIAVQEVIYNKINNKLLILCNDIRQQRPTVIIEMVMDISYTGLVVLEWRGG